MPRPKHNPDALLKLELRISPPDGKEITDWKIGEDFKMLLAGQEGGDEECRLHYHCYVETTRSRSWLTKWIYSIAHCYNGETGNPVFFTRAPHEATIGYCVKDGHIAVRHGCSDTFINEWLAKSRQYKRDKDAARQRDKRIKKAFTQEVRDTIAKRLRESAELRNPLSIVRLVLTEYTEHNATFPTRSVMENLIATLMYPYNPSSIEDFYTRNYFYDNR